MKELSLFVFIYSAEIKHVPAVNLAQAKPMLFHHTLVSSALSCISLLIIFSLFKHFHRIISRINLTLSFMLTASPWNKVLMPASLGAPEPWSSHNVPRIRQVLHKPHTDNLSLHLFSNTKFRLVFLCSLCKAVKYLHRRIKLIQVKAELFARMFNNLVVLVPPGRP